MLGNCIIVWHNIIGKRWTIRGHAAKTYSCEK